MVQDLVHNLCESLVENIGGVASGTPHKAAVATPVITLTENSVTITCATTGAAIYYTLDGSTPTSSSSQYSSAFTLDSSCTIKAIAIKGGKTSGIAEEEYVKPIIYLTQWRMMGNSEVHGQEIWSCGEYSALDGKYHILVQPLGGSIADIALTEPLRMTNNNADSVEYANNAGVVTRNLAEINLGTLNWEEYTNNRFRAFFELPLRPGTSDVRQILNTGGYTSMAGNSINSSVTQDKLIAYITLFVSSVNNGLVIRDESFSNAQDAKQKLAGIYAVYELETPTTEIIEVPQIQEADSYSCVISQGAKAVEWSSFETN